MSDPFDDPGGLDSVKWDSLEHRLVLITPLDRRDDVPTPDGRDVREVIYGRIVVLDGPDAPRVVDYSPVFPRFIQGQIRGNLGTGRSNLGRVGKDPTRQKPGQSAPWVLGTPTDADKAIARAYLAGAGAQSPASRQGYSAGTPQRPPSAPSPAAAEPPF